MDENNSIQLFEDRKIRTAWDEEKEEWYFSVVDVIAVLTDQPTARNASTYWAVLKKRLKEEGASELLTNCKQLKMRATDGKMRLTDVASTEQLLRIIQSIPSPKAEPFKRWLAQVGRERIEETIDPEQAIDRALETYQKKGYDADWIHQRILSIRVRNELTAEWQARGVEQGREYAILTDEITKAWSGMTTRQYKNLKGLKKENLRDNMSTTEIILNIFKRLQNIRAFICGFLICKQWDFELGPFIGLLYFKIIAYRNIRRNRIQAVLQLTGFIRTNGKAYITGF